VLDANREDVVAEPMVSLAADMARKSISIHPFKRKFGRKLTYQYPKLLLPTRLNCVFRSALHHTFRKWRPKSNIG
jgi:hypothetical protein